MIKLKKSLRLTPIAFALGLSFLAGCSTVNELLGSEESVDYKSTVRGDPLSIPPDLTQAHQGAQYRAPEGVTTFSHYAQTQEERRASGSRSEVLPEQDGIEVMRDGDMRWLVVDQSPADLYPRIIEFWGQQGFTIDSEDPRTGVIQTHWAENRSKIPEGWIRRALGSIIDQVFDSGERERFRTRLERVGDKTEIYISHQHMEETPTQDGTTFKWVFGDEDPGLNAAMLARLMVYLGAERDSASDRVKAAEEQQRRPEVQVEELTGESILTLGEGFDRAWRRVGLAIDSAGFSVEDRDRSTGEFFIRYLDADTGVKIEQQNIIGRLFGGRDTSIPEEFTIRVREQAGQSIVQVLDKEGQVQQTDTARRILHVIAQHMTGT